MRRARPRFPRRHRLLLRGGDAEAVRAAGRDTPPAQYYSASGASASLGGIGITSTGEGTDYAVSPAGGIAADSLSFGAIASVGKRSRPRRPPWDRR